MQLRQQSQGHSAAPLLPGAGSGRKALQSISYGLFAWLYSRPALYRLFSLCAAAARLDAIVAGLLDPFPCRTAALGTHPA